MLKICCIISDDVNENNIRQVQETEDDGDYPQYDETYDGWQVLYFIITYSIMLKICCIISDDVNENNIRQVQETEDDGDYPQYDETYDGWEILLIVV